MNDYLWLSVRMHVNNYNLYGSFLNVKNGSYGNGMIKFACYQKLAQF